MKFNLIKRTFRSIRQQPFISTVSLIGTALSIFLIMVVVMTNELPFTDIAPEKHKDRWLTNDYLSIKNTNWEGQSHGAMGFNTLRRVFYNMKTPEEVTGFTRFFSF